MRYLAIDLGDKRTGLAVGDDETDIVSPLEVIKEPIDPPHRLIDRIKKAIDEQGADAVVLGLPLHMDGSEGDRAKKTRAVGEILIAQLGLPIHYEDERLTSAAADWAMAGSGMTHAQKKNRRDAMAAAAILKTFLADRGDSQQSKPS